MNFIAQNLQALTTLFGVVTTLAVLVTGFFMGRAWLSKTDDIAAMKHDHESMERDGL